MMNCFKIFYSLLGVAIFSSVERISCLSLEKSKSVQDAVIDPEFENVVVTKNIDTNGKKIYNLKAFGEDLKLVVSKNDKLAKPHAEVIKRHNGRTISREKIADLGYHTGFVDSMPRSHLSVKIKNDYLSGVIFTDSHFITIDGLSDDFSGSGLRHVISRRKHEEEDSKFFNSRASILKTSHLQNLKRNKRSVKQYRYVEAMIVADNSTYAFYGNHTLQYIMAVAYLTNAVFHSGSIGEIKLVYAVVKVMILTGYDEGLDYLKHNTVGSVAYLKLFVTWASQFKKKNDSDPEHFDQGLLLSKRLCGLQKSCGESGRGYMRGMCSERLSMISAAAYGLRSGLAVAHEIGHNLGLSHNSGPCARRYIMDSVLSSGGNAFKWSSCSREKIQSWFNDKNKFKCLYDKPLNQFSSNSIVNLAMNYSGDDQCRLVYGPVYGQCKGLVSNCQKLYCAAKSRGNVCFHHGSPPLEGTTCGTYKWCIDGLCVDRPIPSPINGNWGSWSTTFSDCTKSCGIGIRHRTRNCDNPIPEYFGLQCPGESKGQFETCNTRDCSSSTVSFRLQQCLDRSKTFTSYHFSGSSPCILICKRTSGSGVASIYGTVKDGTRCSRFQDVYDVCVRGKCLEMGCDRKIHSRKRFDRCGVCDGNGTTCVFTTGTYTGRPRRTGGANAEVMVTLPIGSTHFYIKEPYANWNEIGVKDQNDVWIIGPRKFSTMKYFAGARITYDRESSVYAETITISGPINQPLKIMFVYLSERNVATHYKYYKPLATPDTNPVTCIWNYTMSECDQTCAGGASHVIPRCYRADDNSEVGIIYCDAATKPSGSVPCNIQACDPRWEISMWSQCNATCGPSGTRTRSVECRQKISNTVDQIVDVSKCTGTQAKSVVCNRKDCEPDWEAGEWTACSNKKCQGTQTRQIYCKKILLNGDKQDLRDSECTTQEPITTVECNSGIRCYEWRSVLPSCTECEVLEPVVTSDLGYKEIGCFNLNTAPFGSALVDLRNPYFPSNKQKIVKECATYAWKRARKVFGVGNDGICYSSMDAHETYYKDGRSSNCINNIGGEGAMFVYALKGFVLVSNQTCFHVENDSQVQNSNCDDPMPLPEIKICCEDVCEDRCIKTENGQYCSIPYIYNGEKHYGCIRNNQDKLWCATTSNYDIDEKGGNCKESCRQKTHTGQCCSLPFIYRGRIYNTCVESYPGERWCALTSNYDIDFSGALCA